MRKIYIIMVTSLYISLMGLAICSKYEDIYVRLVWLSVLVMILIWNSGKKFFKVDTEKMYVLSLIAGIFILAWELSTTYFKVLNPILFPKPEEVINAYIDQFIYLVQCMCSSLQLIGIGYLYAIPLGIGFGVIVGWKKRVREIIIPIVKVLSSIPPVIYAPYLIAIASSFRGASILLLAMTMFWSIFMNTVSRVETIDKRILQTVEPLGLNTYSMIINILIPYVLPGVVRGLKISFSSSFVMLVFAEMIGASAGLGYFIKLYSDYANYSNVVAGIILVAALVLVINKLFLMLEQKLVKW